MKISKNILPYFILLTIVFHSNLFGQPIDTLWNKTYDFAENERANSIQVTANGNYIIAGNYERILFTENIFLFMTDSLGALIWSKFFISELDHKVTFLNITQDGGFILTGTLGGKLFLLKTDENGNELWQKYYDINGHSSIGASVVPTYDGGYLITGQLADWFLVLKVDSVGTTEWWKIMPYDGRGSYGIQLADSNFVVCGTVYLNWHNIYLAKLNNAGNQMWEKTYGENHHSNGYCVKEIEDGNLLLCGLADLNIPDANSWLLKTNSTGDTIWTKSLPGSRATEVFNVKDRGFILVGTMAGKPLLIRTNSNGELWWTKLFSRTTSDLITSMQVTSDNSFILCGYTTVLTDTTKDIWLIKTKQDTGILTNIFDFDDTQKKFDISQNYPNPFNPSTKVNFTIPISSFIKIKIYDVLGKEVATLVDEYKSAGGYEIEFNATNLSSGFYFYRIQTNDYVETKKMILIK